jgi:hypothetical protein
MPSTVNRPDAIAGKGDELCTVFLQEARASRVVRQFPQNDCLIEIIAKCRHCVRYRLL